MRKWLPAIFCLLLPVLALAQSQPSPPFVNAPNTGPGNPLTAGELNAAFAQKQDAITFGSGVLAALANAANATGGICTNGGGGCAGGSSAFSALTGGTNTSAAMLVGTGASLGPAGSGTVTANVVSNGTVGLSGMANLPANSIIGNNTGAPATPIALTAAQVKTLLAIQTTDVTGPTGGGTQCLQVNNAGAISGTAASCGGSGSTGGNPTATAGPTAINGVATTFMRSDAAPAVQLGTNAQQGIIEGDGNTISCSSGICGLAAQVLAGTTQTITAGQWAAGDTFGVTTAAQTLTLPLSTGLSANGGIVVQTIGQSVTLAPNASDAINGGTAGASVTIASGLTALVTRGAGANTINVSPTTGGSSGFPITIGGQTINSGGSTTNQGNGGKIQLSTGTTTTNDCVKFDANGNTVDAGGTCGTGSTGITFTDGTHTVSGATQLTVTGGTVGGTSPNATLTVTGGGGASTIVAPQGRLTLISHTPVMTTDQVGKATIYDDCFVGTNVPYYTGSADALDTITGCELSLTMQATGTGVINANDVFDVFYSHAHLGDCIATNGSGGGWSSDTGGALGARGTGYSQIHNTRGYYTNQNAVAHCYNGATDYGSAAADTLTWRGTFYSTAAGQTTMQVTRSTGAGGTNPCMCLFNAYNLVDAFAETSDTTLNWFGVAGGAWRQSDGSASNQIRAVFGLPTNSVSATFSQFVDASGNGGSITAIGLDSSTTPYGFSSYSGLSGTGYQTFTVINRIAPQVGFHAIEALEWESASNHYANYPSLSVQGRF